MDIKDSYLHGTVGVVKSISVSADKLKYKLADIAGTVKEVTLPVATTSANGLMSSGDKTKLDNLSTTLGNYVTLNTDQEITGTKTFTKQLKFTVAAGTSPFTVDSGTKVTNLNADRLDDRHASDFAYCDAYPTESSNNWAILSGIYRTTLNSTGLPANSNGHTLIHGNYDSNAATQLFLHYNADKIHFRRKQSNSWKEWKQIAFTDSDITGNAATATHASTADKLKTKRKLWGLDFDGSADVSGTLSNVNNIYGSSSESFYLYLTKNPTNAGNLGTAVGLGCAPNSYGLFMWGTEDGKGHIQVGRKDNSNTAYDIILQEFGGKVGIGTEDPAYALDVNGTIRANGNILLESANNGGGNINGGGIAFWNGSGYVGGTINAATLILNNGSTSGNVGIGTIKPTHKLTVNGNVKATSFIGNLDWSYVTNKPTSFTPAAHDHKRIVSSDDSYVGVEPSALPSSYEKGVTFNTCYSANWPSTYGNLLTLRGRGDSQIFVTWSAVQTATVLDVSNEIYLRSKRDSIAGDVWSNWTRVLTNKNYGSYVAAKAHTHPTSDINLLTGYTIATTRGAVAATDSLNTALGKLEYKAILGETAYDWYKSVTGTDNDDIINKWEEIVGFLDSVKEGTDILDEFVTRKTKLTITGLKNFTEILTSSKQLILKGPERSDIINVLNADKSITTNAPTSAASIKNALQFNWYDTSWEIGNIRGGSSNTVGFGITSGKDTLCFRVTTTNCYVGSNVILHAGNSHITNGVITINGTSITPLTAHQSLANYVTLNTAQTISGVKTFSTLLKFTVAQGTAPFTVTSTTKVTNLNADLLDGYDSSAFFKYINQIISSIDANTLRGNGIRFNTTGNGSGNSNVPDTYGFLIQFDTDRTPMDYGGILMHLTPGNILKVRSHWDSRWKTWTTILGNNNYTDYVNTTNFPGLNKVGTVTSVTVTGSNGLSGTGTITTSGTITLSNAGVRSTTINGNYLRVNTNGTNADLTIPYATSSGSANKLNSANLKSARGAHYYYTGKIVASTDNTGEYAGPNDSGAYSSVLRLQSHDTAGELYYRDLIFDVNSDSIWSRRVTNSNSPVVRALLHSGNYTDYTVKKDGTGATGTWNISISGNAASASTAAKLSASTVVGAKALSLSNASWTDTGYTFASLASGTYAVQITSGTNLVASGIMSVYKNLSDTAGDEIPLHVYGTAGWRPYLRTYANKLLISSNDTSSTKRTVTIKIALIL